MLQPAPESYVQNASLVTGFFGKWPSFHDAEVLSIELDRTGPTIVFHLYVFEMSGDRDEHGYYKQQKHCVITFRCTGIEDLNICEFNEQNVIAGLAVENIQNGLRTVLSSCYGISAKWKCQTMEVVEVKPTEPEQIEGRSP